MSDFKINVLNFKEKIEGETGFGTAEKAYFYKSNITSFDLQLNSATTINIAFNSTKEHELNLNPAEDFKVIEEIINAKTNKFVEFKIISSPYKNEKDEMMFDLELHDAFENIDNVEKLIKEVQNQAKTKEQTMIVKNLPELLHKYGNKVTENKNTKKLK
jgi:hypothetical protein